jgi:hypothetical protein
MSTKVDANKLKEMVKLLNTSEYEVEGGGNEPFLETKIKTVGVSTDKLKTDFETAISKMDEDIQGVLPDAIIDFYNDLVNGEGEGEPEPEPESKDKKAATTKETPKAADKKKEMKKKEPGKKKEPAELSAFGHKVGSQAAKIDALLTPGKSISLEDLIKGSGRSALGVKSHIKHLIEARNLTINVKDNMYRFVKNPTK